MTGKQSLLRHMFFCLPVWIGQSSLEHLYKHDLIKPNSNSTKTHLSSLCCFSLKAQFFPPNLILSSQSQLLYSPTCLAFPPPPSLWSSSIVFLPLHCLSPLGRHKSVWRRSLSLTSSSLSRAPAQPEESSQGRKTLPCGRRNPFKPLPWNTAWCA